MSLLGDTDANGVPYVGVERAIAEAMNVGVPIVLSILVFVLVVYFIRTARRMRARPRPVQAASAWSSIEYLKPEDRAWLTDHGWEDPAPKPIPLANPRTNAPTCVCGDSDEPHDPARHADGHRVQPMSLQVGGRYAAPHATEWPGLPAGENPFTSYMRRMYDADRVARDRIVAIEGRITSLTDQIHPNRSSHLHYMTAQIDAMKRLTEQKRNPFL